MRPAPGACRRPAVPREPCGRVPRRPRASRRASGRRREPGGDGRKASACSRCTRSRPAVGATAVAVVELTRLCGYAELGIVGSTSVAAVGPEGDGTAKSDREAVKDEPTAARSSRREPGVRDPAGARRRPLRASAKLAALAKARRPVPDHGLDEVFVQSGPSRSPTWRATARAGGQCRRAGSGGRRPRSDDQRRWSSSGAPARGDGAILRATSWRRAPPGDVPRVLPDAVRAVSEQLGAVADRHRLPAAAIVLAADRDSLPGRTPVVRAGLPLR